MQVLREANVDAMYYDISANNLIKVCAAQTHTHTPGGGREITEGYRDIYADTGDALSREAGRPIPLGTEQMCEVFLDRLDFYQARAWAQPCSTLETWPLRGQMLSGQARMIPLFDMVYHEYGVVRMDGWGKLTDAIGGLFFDTVAKTYLWGGLYEVNHEYSPMEELDGVENPPEEHYFRFDPQHCAYSGGRAAYVGRFAAARLGRANPYWVYGRMLPAPAIDAPVRKLAWYHYNHGPENPAIPRAGRGSLPGGAHVAFPKPGRPRRPVHGLPWGGTPDGTIAASRAGGTLRWTPGRAAPLPGRGRPDFTRFWHVGPRPQRGSAFRPGAAGALHVRNEYEGGSVAMKKVLCLLLTVAVTLSLVPMAMAESASTTEGKTEIVLWNQIFEDWNRAWCEQMVAEYNAIPDNPYYVTQEFVDGSAWDEKVAAARAAGTMPDVYLVNYSNIPWGVTNGYFMPLDDLIPRRVGRPVRHTSMDMVTVDGRAQIRLSAAAGARGGHVLPQGPAGSAGPLRAQDLG